MLAVDILAFFPIPQFLTQFQNLFNGKEMAAAQAGKLLSLSAYRPQHIDIPFAAIF